MGVDTGAAGAPFATVDLSFATVGVLSNTIPMQHHKKKTKRMKCKCNTKKNQEDEILRKCLKREKKTRKFHAEKNTPENARNHVISFKKKFWLP